MDRRQRQIRARLPRRRYGRGRGEQRGLGPRRSGPGRRQGHRRHRARRAPHLAARRRRRLRRARRAAPPGRRVQLVARVAAARRQRVLDRVVIEYSALGNRGLLWVVGGVAVGLATQRCWAIPLVAARRLDHARRSTTAIKRIVRRERPLERARARAADRGARRRRPSRRATPRWRRAGAVALSVYAPALAAVRYPGHPDGCLARLPRRPPRLRRRRRPGRGRLHGRGLRAAGRLMASLEVGIVGLPNSGKTSLFNALTDSHAEITSYAAVQASANVGIAAVPDERIAALAQAVSARDQVPATVQFSDVAGLVRGSGNARRRARRRVPRPPARDPRAGARRAGASTTRPSRTPTAASIPCSTPRPSTSSSCSPIRCSSRGGASAPSAPRAWARRARATSSSCSIGSRRTSTRACPRARSTSRCPRASTCSPPSP